MLVSSFLASCSTGLFAARDGANVGIPLSRTYHSNPLAGLSQAASGGRTPRSHSCGRAYDGQGRRCSLERVNRRKGLLPPDVLPVAVFSPPGSRRSAGRTARRRGSRHRSRLWESRTVRVSERGPYTNLFPDCPTRAALVLFSFSGSARGVRRRAWPQTWMRGPS